MRLWPLIVAALVAPALASARGTTLNAPLLAFSRCGPDGCASGTDIWVIREDGSNLKRVTRAGIHNEYPSWSPDGRQIAFSRSNARSSGIWTFDFTTSKIRRLTISSTPDKQPAWSPDGGRIAFVRQLPRGSSAIETVAPDGSALTRLTWSPGDYQHPTWSADGRRIAFAYSRDPQRQRYEIVVVGVRGTGRRILARDRRYDYLDPAWSPDGRHIAFALLTRRRHTFSADLEIMASDGSRRQVVAHAAANTLYFAPNWAPDGQTLAFVSLSKRLNEGRLGFVKLNGTGLRVLTQIASDNRGPVWRPSGPRRSRPSDRSHHANVP